MSANEHECSADERFERRLLDSARSDELPRDLDSAWQKFDSALRGVSALAAGTGGALAARKAQRWLAAKWLVWGALAGSALTVLGMRVLPVPHIETSTVLSPPVALTIASIVPSSRVAAPAADASERARASNAGTAGPPRALTSRSHSQRALGTAAPTSRPSPPSSTLAAQVALLDAARTAISSGAASEALRLADRYRIEFPNGELAPEAEVVAIEALVARGAHADASERAASFLARYPGDPHAARVKRLVH